MARLRRRGDSYVVDYYRDGKRVRKSFSDLDTAQSVIHQLNLQELKAEMGLQVDVPLKHIKINEAIRQYYKLRSESKVTAKTDRGYFSKFFDFIHVNRGLVYLHEISFFHMEEYQKERIKLVKASSVNREFHTLSAFFNKAVEWGWLSKSPVKVKKLKELPNPYKVWTNEEIEMMIDCLPKWAANIFSFIAQTGCRPCEARSLKWKHVLFSHNLVKLESLKNAGVERVFPVSDRLMDFLSKLQDGQIKHAEDYVFSFDGKPIAKDHLGNTVKKYREELELREGLSLYGLRHRYATVLATSDVNQDKIRQLMGHSSVKTTQRYVNMNVDDLREAASIGAPKLRHP